MKKLWILSFATIMMVACGGDKEVKEAKEASVDACSCLKDAEELAKKMMEAGTDADKLKAFADEADELSKKCDAAAKADEESWAKALRECK